MSLLNPMDDDQLDAIIEGLERIKSLEGEVERLRAELARLRLTDAEWVVFGKVLRRLRESMWSDSSIELVQMASVIDGFLYRHKGGGR